MTIIYYFNVIINMSIITDPTFSRALKTFICFLIITSCLLNYFFEKSTVFTFFYYAILLIRLLTVSTPKFDLKGLLNLSSTHTYF